MTILLVQTYEEVPIMTNDINIMKEKKISLFKPKRNTDNEDLIKIIYDLKDELEFVHRNLNYATDIALIDSLIYEIKSLNSKYEYYIKLCKEKGLNANKYNKIS